MQFKIIPQGAAYLHQLQIHVTYDFTLTTFSFLSLIDRVKKKWPLVFHDVRVSLYIYAHNTARNKTRYNMIYNTTLVIECIYHAFDQKEASKLERIHRPCTAVHVAVGFACTKHDGAKKHLLH